MMSVKDMRIFRNHHGIPLLELSAHCGLTEDYLFKIEEEIIQPTSTDMPRIERTLIKLSKQDRTKEKDDE